MPLGTAGFNPSEGDLVKVVTDRYPSVPKGIIARVSNCYMPLSKYTVEGFEDILIDMSDLEIVSYKRVGKQCGDLNLE